MAAQWSRQLDFSRANEVEIEVTDWAGRFAWVGQIYYRVCFCCLIRLLCSLDTIGRTAFSNDFNCLSGQPHALAEALDGLTNNENCRSSFYMRALFWIFPSILKVGKKGKMIKETRKELGEIASRLWQDAKVAGDSDNRTLMSLMRKNIPLFGYGNKLTGENDWQWRLMQVLRLNAWLKRRLLPSFGRSYRLRMNPFPRP